MKQLSALKNRKDLENKMATVFAEKTKCLSTEFQKILLDDMVTAFESRLTILNHAQTRHPC